MSIALRKFYQNCGSAKEKFHSKYGKTESDIDCDVNILKEWLKKQPYIPEIKDDEFLKILLLRNKYRIEKTKLKIDKYFSVKTAYADIFLKANPFNENYKFIDTYVEECIMPKLCPDGSRLFYLSTRQLKNEDDLDFQTLFGYLMIRAESHIILDYNDSITMVLNAENLTMSLVRQVKISDVMRGKEIFLEAFSTRVVILIAINMIPAAETLYTILKTLLPAKLKDKVHLLKKDSVEKLFERVPRDCLPIEIGGTGPSIKQLTSSYNEAVQQDREYIVKRNQNGTTESKRIGKPAIDMAMYGVEGTFKQINID